MKNRFVYLHRSTPVIILEPSNAAHKSSSTEMISASATHQRHQWATIVTARSATSPRQSPGSSSKSKAVASCWCAVEIVMAASVAKQSRRAICAAEISKMPRADNAIARSFRRGGVMATSKSSCLRCRRGEHGFADGLRAAPIAR